MVVNYRQLKSKRLLIKYGKIKVDRIQFGYKNYVSYRKEVIACGF
ncbi:hypothetical protein HMPREF9406_3470 [Clostridium sp. HGF2]|nr:hypothetical protein HMPREF9406_3470 [Clostridium sp. HGF2]EQJ51418.1 hypothetical protein QSI_4322 [Clostridioides difficile P28]